MARYRHVSFARVLTAALGVLLVGAAADSAEAGRGFRGGFRRSPAAGRARVTRPTRLPATPQLKPARTARNHYAPIRRPAAGRNAFPTPGGRRLPARTGGAARHKNITPPPTKAPNLPWVKTSPGAGGTQTPGTQQGNNTGRYSETRPLQPKKRPASGRRSTRGIAKTFGL